MHIGAGAINFIHGSARNRIEHPVRDGGCSAMWKADHPPRCCLPAVAVSDGELRTAQRVKPVVDTKLRRDLTHMGILSRGPRGRSRPTAAA